MNCPVCQAETTVLDSRGVENWTGIRRRRECAVCGHRFTTFEFAENVAAAHHAAIAKFARDLRQLTERFEQAQAPHRQIYRRAYRAMEQDERVAEQDQRAAEGGT